VTLSTLCQIAAVCLVLSPSPALAWANGEDGCNSFGTHDVILAAALAFSDETWVMRRVAMRATDDPDCKDDIDHASGTWWHVYDRWGETYGGADEAARVWFNRMQRRLDAGNERGASKALGILAHIVGDVAQPMHTDSRPREDRVHSNYEDAVDRRVLDYGFVSRGTEAAKPGPRVRRLARNAHESYFELIRAYDDHGYNATVHRITKRQLNRAANALADLMAAVP
jgi:hypothetical protein